MYTCIASLTSLLCMLYSLAVSNCVGGARGVASSGVGSKVMQAEIEHTVDLSLALLEELLVLWAYGVSQSCSTQY